MKLQASLDPRGPALFAGRAAVLAWSVAALSITLTAATVVLALASDHIPGGGDDRATAITELVPQLLFGITGGVVAANRPRNPIGWILAAMAAAWSVQAAAGYYALYAFEEASWLPGADLASVIFAAGWAAPILALPALFTLFPTGRLLSPRWRGVLIGLAVPSAAVVGLVVVAMPVGGPDLLHDIENVELVSSTDALIAVFLVSVIVLVAAGVVSLGIRFRRSGPTERNQIKYLILAGLGLVASAATSNLLELPVLLSDAFSLATFAAVPVAIGAAMLRYGLYDIDRIINRTIVYTVVTGTALAVYAATVFVVGSFVAGSREAFTVALATLAAAAVFRPALRRVQRLVDRRFYRRKYDAAATIDAFGARLREEIDLNELTGHLVDVALVTMQPARASVWLRARKTAR